MARGAFITFEGIDGAGKTTHVERAVARLQAAGLRTVRTREPGGTPLGESLRALLIGESMSAEAEALLAFAARREHLTERIEPALADGTWVVCDRFTDATYAYQGGGRGLDFASIELIEKAARIELRPDLTVLFDLSAVVAAARRAGARAADRFEQEDSDFFERVRTGYARRRAADPARFVVVDAQADPAAVGAAVERAIDALAARWPSTA